MFTTLEANGVPKSEAIKLIFDCPKLLSVNLEASMKETFYVFDLYHKITPEEVMGVFRAFPYLFCCDTIKMRFFMGQFRKYRLSKDQILHLVSFYNLTLLV